MTQTASSSPAPSTAPPTGASGSPTAAPSTPGPVQSSAPAAVTSAAHAPASWSQTFSTVSTGVVRLDSICDTEDDDPSISTGSGFLVAPNLVLTVAHVVEDAGALRITSPTSGQVFPGQVIGVDDQDDIALIRSAGNLPGHVFTIADRSPEIGDDMAAIGFPLGGPMQLSIGHVTGTHDHRTVGGEYDLSDVLLSDAALNPGNSGGPWIDQSGQVMALTESGPPQVDQGDRSPADAQGNNGGVSALDAQEQVGKWRAAPDPQPARTCHGTGAGQEAIETLQLYFADIDNSDYASAYAQLYSDSRHPISGLSSFIDGVQSTTDSSGDGSGDYFFIQDTGTIGGHEFVDATFQSQQHAAQGPNGETCTDWSLRYGFRSSLGLQYIESVTAIPGTAEHRSC